MTVVTEDQERAEQEFHSAAEDFSIGLRLAHGMDEAALSRLREATIRLGFAWESEDYLPKSVVHDLVGLYSWIYSASYLYEGDEASAIKRAAAEVETLIFQHVAPAPNDDSRME